MNYYEEIQAAGHILIRDDSGKVDGYQLMTDNHAGPGCAVCGKTWCEWCAFPVEPCIGAEGVAKRKLKADVDTWLRLTEEYGKDGPCTMQ